MVVPSHSHFYQNLGFSFAQAFELLEIGGFCKNKTPRPCTHELQTCQSWMEMKRKLTVMDKYVTSWMWPIGGDGTHFWFTLIRSSCSWLTPFHGHKPWA